MNKVLIIAEAGVNHNADIDIAKKLIDVAFESGADIVKFQTAIPELVMTANAEKAVYQINNTKNSSESQLEMAKKIHLPLDAYKELLSYANRVGIKFLSTPFDMVSIDYLKGLGLDIFKIPSGEITNLPYLRAIGKLKCKVILSTGMTTMDEIGEALDVLIDAGTPKCDITILHCNTDYPTKMIDVNLKAMIAIGEKYGVNIGYSDHTLGIEVPVAAVALGASVIEKHFTLDKTMEGPDHAASLEPSELKAMVTAIRNIEEAISGSGEKIPSTAESKNIKIARKSIVASKNIKKGELFSENNLTVKRPGNGISPMRWDEVIGTSSSKDYNADDLIEI
ncbi:N-acetylneuraminate synthase [Elizabethkingia anophelis]|uniref:N-acetylneuraminate synthase n=1 Tax=Elizabethkingia anophelis TaxID=1117645 RepID=UPI000999CE8F|nr:N-acetylneuraminate synthase [Elizabethkingia anophelis]MCT4223066.1 N-acetylneuraminate synthase [Elizabethkingia anophelis]MCT4330835.1 N-acetylneuraminate synthase [Elizabethkingia anophelis]MDV3865654.1 N-acetylneuraminate synthase [Elizabethkingia anophelis]MYY26417.1 N-acetylneuraminate synthase [Elizabethkingia anophelis]OPC46273.1 N-acetylneuraminate synthase [Elizabethkingia anophelis]